jgi:hypothetical protein
MGRRFKITSICLLVFVWSSGTVKDVFSAALCDLGVPEDQERPATADDYCTDVLSSYVILNDTGPDPTRQGLNE